MTPQSLRRAAVPLVLLLSAACASRPTGTIGEPSPEAPPAPPRTADVARPGGAVAGVEVRVPARPTATSWRFAWAPGAQRYEVIVEGAVEDSSREQERVVTRAVVTTELEAARVRGTVDSLFVDASERVTGGAAPPGWEPVRFAGTTDARGVRVEAADPGAELRCSTPIAAAVALARETVPRIPAALTIGARWQDSSVVESCRSLVPTTVHAQHTYEVVSAELLDSGAEVLRIRRRSTVRVQGQGLARGRPTTVTGSGTGEATLLVEPGAGRLVAVDGESRSTLTVALPDGARTFSQVARTMVRGR